MQFIFENKEFAIKNINDFYNYTDANFLHLNDFFVFNIDIDNLSNDDKYQIKLICDCLNTRIVCGNIQENGNWQIKELPENDVFYVNNYISCSKNYYVKAKLNHLLFFKTTEKNRIIYARNAIDSYIIAYQNSINSDDIWINASQIYNNLVDLAFKINYQKNAVLQISINNIKKWISDILFSINNIYRFVWTNRRVC